MSAENTPATRTAAEIQAELESIDLAALRASQIDPKAAIKAHIASLEASITPRRLREAVLSGDHAFITGVDAHIEALRAKL